MDSLRETSLLRRPRYQFTAVDPTERHYFAQRSSREEHYAFEGPSSTLAEDRTAPAAYVHY